MAHKGGITRRTFLARSAKTAAIAGVTAKNVAAAVGANERIRIGAIGCGVMGRGHVDGLSQRSGELGVEVISICDVYRKRISEALKSTGARQGTMEYREVLDNKDVDVVLNATPDHWHAKIAIEACQADKDVYTEKPMCHTLGQAKALVAAVKKTRRIVQVGVQSASYDVNHKVRREIEKGTIGKMVMITSSYSRNGKAGEWRDFGLRHPGGVEGVDLDARPGPDLDWDRFCGHEWGLAPRRPFSHGRFFQFRCYWDYSGGIATDLLFHRLARLIQATGLGFPQRVSAGGGVWEFNQSHVTPQGYPDDREVPDTYATTIDYAGGPTVVLASSMANDRNLPERIAGHYATISFKDNDAVIQPQGISDKKEAVVLKGERKGDHVEHWRNFLRCLRDRKEPACPVTLGYKTNVAITLGIEAYKRNKVMTWDPDGEVGRS